MHVKWNQVSSAVCALAAAALIAAGVPGDAAPPARPARKPVTPQAVKNLPDLKKPEDKLRFLEMMRQAFPAVRSGSGSAFLPRHLDDVLQQQVAGSTRTPFMVMVFAKGLNARQTTIAPSSKPGLPGSLGMFGGGVTA